MGEEKMGKILKIKSGGRCGGAAIVTKVLQNYDRNRTPV